MLEGSMHATGFEKQSVVLPSCESGELQLGQSWQDLTTAAIVAYMLTE